jgi:hypothetical protein
MMRADESAGKNSVVFVGRGFSFSHDNGVVNAMRLQAPKHRSCICRRNTMRSNHADH